MRILLYLLGAATFILFSGCVQQQQNMPGQAVYSYSLDSQLDNLSNQIVDSLTQKQKSKIAVIEFSDLDGNITEFGKYLSEELITRLFLTDKFYVVERSLLNKILEEHKFNLSGLVDENTIKELGKLLGVDAIASGSITDLGDYVKVNARLISTETGSVFSAAAVKIKKDQTVTTLLGKISSSSQSLVKSKKTKQLTTSSLMKGAVFFQEDFSEIEEGMLPEGWSGGEKLMVRKIGGKKLLTNFERINQTFTVYNVIFPENFRFEWIIEPRGVNQRLTIGNVRIEVAPDSYASGKYVADFKMDRKKRKIEGNFNDRIVKVGFEKKGPLCRLLLDDNEVFLARYSDFTSPNSFSFEFGKGPFKLYSIIGKELSE